MIVSRHGRRPIILRVSAAAWVAAAVSAGCSGGGSSASPSGTSTSSMATGSTSPSNSPSPTPIPSPSLVPPVLPAAAKQPTQAGAEAFYRYFWDTYAYAFLGRDEEALSRICDSASKFCSSAYERIRTMISLGQKQVGGRVHPKAVKSSPVSTTKVALVDGVIDQDGGTTVDSAGSAIDTLVGHHALVAKGVFKWEEGAWRALGMEIAK